MLISQRIYRLSLDKKYSFMCIIKDTVQKNNTVEIKTLPVRINKIYAGKMSYKLTGNKTNGGAAKC